MTTITSLRRWYYTLSITLSSILLCSPLTQTETKWTHGKQLALSSKIIAADDRFESPINTNTTTTTTSTSILSSLDSLSSSSSSSSTAVLPVADTTTSTITIDGTVSILNSSLPNDDSLFKSHHHQSIDNKTSSLAASPSSSTTTTIVPSSSSSNANSSSLPYSSSSSQSLSSSFPTASHHHQPPLESSAVPTTISPFSKPFSGSIGATSETPSTVSNSETRLRWVDFRRHQAYPPLVPSVPGIPSGFRNPIVSSASSVVGAVVANPMTSTIQPTGSMYNPGAHHSFFSGSSSNPVGFGGSVIMEEDPPFKLSNPNRRYNITRVEHITAECSDEYMKVVLRFNGTFTGMVYSSGYVHDPNCIYVNGSGRSYYEFFIRLNQCGTLGRQEMYHPTMPGEARRRDQLMWNTLSIQYNAMIEEEFDEHFRLTCEYGSDFWKTVTFPSVNVEINTGSPVVFTINPPQCQMEIRRGFGIAGTRTSGPVTVGDPLTLLIHMKSEKAGFDILVKNCVAHNGAQQRMQLIDSNGCVTNDKLISPFRGTYNSENGHHVSLYSYLKAFRFTGSPALYLECDIHMCHNRCPPQRCYWRNLAKRSADNDKFNESISSTAKPIVSESISLFQALEVHHEQDDTSSAESSKSETLNDNLVCLRSGGLTLIFVAFLSLMMISLGTSICYCHRMRRLKFYQQNILRESSKTFGGSQCSGQSTIRSGISSFSTSDRSILTDRYRDQFFRFQ